MQRHVISPVGNNSVLKSSPDKISYMNRQINRKLIVILWEQWELTSWHSFLTSYLENVSGTLDKFCYLCLLEVCIFHFQVDAMYTLFKANADKPPIFKNQPPVAGAISWERSLFLRIKHTILRFQEMEDMLNSEQGKLVRHAVISFI